MLLKPSFYKRRLQFFKGSIQDFAKNFFGRKKIIFRQTKFLDPFKEPLVRIILRFGSKFQKFAQKWFFFGQQSFWRNLESTP